MPAEIVIIRIRSSKSVSVNKNYIVLYSAKAIKYSNTGTKHNYIANASSV